MSTLTTNNQLAKIIEKFKIYKNILNTNLIFNFIINIIIFYNLL